MTQIGNLDEDGANVYSFLSVYENIRLPDSTTGPYYLITKFDDESIFKDFPKITQGDYFLEFSSTAFWGIPDEMKQGDTNNFKCTYLVSQDTPSFGNLAAFDQFKTTK